MFLIVRHIGFKFSKRVKVVCMFIKLHDRRIPRRPVLNLEYLFLNGYVLFLFLFSKFLVR